MSDYVLTFTNDRMTSHLVAVWTRDDQPDTDDYDAYVWFVASQVQWVGVSKTSGKTEIVFAAGGNSLETHALPTDVRWAIDYALNGGEVRPEKGVYTDDTPPDPNRFSTLSLCKRFLTAKTDINRLLSGVSADTPSHSV